MHSAIGTDNQMPFTPTSAGNINIQITWNNNVLAKEITPDIIQLFNDVKNDDAKMLIPHTRNEMPYIRMPLAVSASKSAS